MASTKRCQNCKKRRQLSQFYKQPSNKDGLKMRCKRCTLDRYTPVTTGTLTCETCHEEKVWSEFTSHRTQGPSGRSSSCKMCRNLQQVTRIRRKRPILAPCSRKERSDSVYLTRPCEICDLSYPVMKYNQRFCTTCSRFWRGVFSRLTSGRGGAPRVTITKRTVDDVAKRLWHALVCTYCTRKYTEELKKSLDHRVPLHLGADPDDPSNIEICCIECNRSKAWMTLEDWFALCRRVADVQDCRQKEDVA